MMPEKIKVNSRKYDNSIHRSWVGELVLTENSMLGISATFNDEILHPQLGTIKKGTISFEYFWFDQWFNIFRFHDPDGSLRNWYCNISMPPKFSNNTVDYVDLDIDILVWPDMSFDILDRDEFEVNAIELNYTDEITRKVDRNLAKLVEMIGHGQFPFVHELSLQFKQMLPKT